MTELGLPMIRRKYGLRGSSTWTTLKKLNVPVVMPFMEGIFVLPQDFPSRFQVPDCVTLRHVPSRFQVPDCVTLRHFPSRFQLPSHFQPLPKPFPLRNQPLPEPLFSGVGLHLPAHDPRPEQLERHRPRCKGGIIHRRLQGERP